MKADRDLSRSALHIFAGTQVERHAGPAPIVDVQLACNICLGRRIRRHIGFLPIRSNLFAENPAGVVLPAHDILGYLNSIEWLDGLNDLSLLGADLVGIE